MDPETIADGMDGSVVDGAMGSVDGADEQKIDVIDWDKVGKIYKPESAIEEIMNREMNRLQQAVDMSIEN